MQCNLKIAAIQLDASPAPTAGAQWVVLSELFSAGYDYAKSNYRSAEDAGDLDRSVRTGASDKNPVPAKRFPCRALERLEV